jgi:hypothetical protein
VVAVPVPDDDLPVLLADWVRSDHPLRDQVPPLMLVGRTAWGDQTARYLVSDDTWAPTPAARAVLDQLIAEADPPAPTIDETSTASDVLAAYVDLLNAGDRSAAAALWHPMAGGPQLPPPGAHIDYQVEEVRRLRFVSAWWDATWVRVRYREQVRNRDAPYRQAIFTFGRNQRGVFRIASFQLRDGAETGR